MNQPFAAEAPTGAQDGRQTGTLAGRRAAAARSAYLAPTCRGQNFYAIDRGLQGLLDLYMEPALRAHLAPHLQELGGLAGGRLDELAAIADRHTPVLHPRDAFGRDEEWIEAHPAYREMEEIDEVDCAGPVIDKGWVPGPYLARGRADGQAHTLSCSV